MSKKKKQAFWFLGLLLLIFLLQYPTKQAINSSNSTWSMPLNGKVIVIDPGHGGPDGGAVGSDGTVEKDIALSVAKIVQSYLMQHGAIVHLTREEDVDLAAEGTSGLANRKSEDIRNRLAFIQEKEAEFLFPSI